MNEDSDPHQEDPRSKKVVGRTWADLVVGGSYIMGGLLFIAAIIGVAYWTLGSVPSWIFIAILASFAFIPFLMERAKDGSELFVVLDGPMRLTEWRIGHRVPIDLDGSPISFISQSGTRRSLLVDFDPNSLQGKGSMLAECSQFDQIRDLSTVQRLAIAMEEVLKEDRLTMMHVGIEVEKRSREVVDWALRLIYEGTVPTEITEALGIDSVPEPEMSVHDSLDEVLEA